MTTSRLTSVLVIGVLLSSLAACGGDTSKSSTPDTAAAALPAPAATVASAGEVEYQRCLACHQATGMGVPNAFPPLAGSEYVNGSADRMVAIIIHGLQGPITVNGAEYNSAMMPYGTNVPMTDEQIAAVATYTRSSWGNTGSAVSAADVARVRAATASRVTPWTVAELATIK
jgi:mono/diheme cytochrome c family protein